MQLMEPHVLLMEVEQRFIFLENKKKYIYENRR